MKSQYLGVFMYIWWLLKFLVFHLWKAYQIVGKYYQQKKQNVYTTAACSHDYLIWHEHRHWGIVVSGYTFG